MKPLDSLGSRFEVVIVVVSMLVLMVTVGWATAELLWLLVTGLIERTGTVGSFGDVQEGLERTFAGVLLVLIGLELLESVRAYFREHRVRLEMILTVSTIAVVRHVILVDLEHMTAPTLLGISALVLALTIGLFLVRRNPHLDPPAE